MYLNKICMYFSIYGAILIYIAFLIEALESKDSIFQTQDHREVAVILKVVAMMQTFKPLGS